jgi:hypothetical protein
MAGEVERPDDGLKAGRPVALDLLQQSGDADFVIADGGMQHVDHLLLAAGVEKLEAHAHRKQHESEQHDEGCKQDDGH